MAFWCKTRQFGGQAPPACPPLSPSRCPQSRRVALPVLEAQLPKTPLDAELRAARLHLLRLMAAAATTSPPHGGWAALLPQAEAWLGRVAALAAEVRGRPRIRGPSPVPGPGALPSAPSHPQPQAGVPDVLLWLLSGPRRVACARVPAHCLVFSPRGRATCGRLCGRTQTLFLGVGGSEGVPRPPRVPSVSPPCVPSLSHQCHLHVTSTSPPCPLSVPSMSPPCHFHTPSMCHSVSRQCHLHVTFTSLPVPSMSPPHPLQLCSISPPCPIYVPSMSSPCRLCVPSVSPPHPLRAPPVPSVSPPCPLPVPSVPHPYLPMSPMSIHNSHIPPRPPCAPMSPTSPISSTTPLSSMSPISPHISPKSHVPRVPLRLP